MKSIKLALIYFFLAYIISSILGFATYYINMTMTQIVMFTIIPIIFGYFFYLYLKKTKCDLTNSLKETNLLIVFWVIASLLFDGIVYILILPLSFGYDISWVFFTESSLWFYLSYGLIIIVGYISRYVYIRKLKKS
jgi:hypothetical protein